MISAGVSVNSTDASSTGNSALHWAASFGNENVVRLETHFLLFFKFSLEKSNEWRIKL